MIRAITIVATIAALAASATPAWATTSKKPVQRGTASYTLTNTMVSGIIMRDGGVCDPIRHMGC